MPFESSLPPVIACLLGAAACLFLWLRAQGRGLLVGAALLAMAGLGAFVADALVVTDREQLLALFPRLAHAAEKQDVATIMSALDPDLRPLREEAERVLKHVRPTEVVITRCDVVVDPAKNPPEAIASLIVRATGDLIDRGPGTVLARIKVRLHKKNGQWLVVDAENEPIGPRAGHGQRPLA